MVQVNMDYASVATGKKRPRSDASTIDLLSEKIRSPKKITIVKPELIVKNKQDEELELEKEMVSLFLPPTDPNFAQGQGKKLASTLNDIEEKFLGENYVATPDTTEAELATFFGSTTMDEHGVSVTEYVDTVLTPMVDDSVHCCAPKMIGHMTTSLPYYMRPLAKLLTTLHANTVKVETAKAQTFMEKEALAMVHRELFHLDDEFYKAHSARPDCCLGAVTSGGTIANNTALWIARNKALPAKGAFKGVDKQGITAGLLEHGFKGAVVIGSAVMHYSMKKSADVLGIGTEGLLTIPFGADYRVDVGGMRVALLDCREKKICVLALVGVCGGTETGSIDDLAAIADLAEEFGVHFHVDAAWGGPVIFSKQHKHLIKGMERAHTVTLDGHKQLYTPMGCGMCFLRDPYDIAAVEKTANYIIRKDSYDMGKFSMEGSRPAVSLFLHANLRILGVTGYGSLVDKSIRTVAYMVKALRKTGAFETVLDPMTNILLYRFLPEAGGIREAALAAAGATAGADNGDCNGARRIADSGVSAPLTPAQNAAVDAANVRLQTLQKKAGATFVSRTTIFSPVQQVRVVALRVVIANPRTTYADIDATLADQLSLAKTLLQ